MPPHVLLQSTDQMKGEPDEFVIVKNAKAAGGVIPYARYGDQWTANPIPNRPLIRSLARMCEMFRQGLETYEEQSNVSGTKTGVQS